MLDLNNIEVIKVPAQSLDLVSARYKALNPGTTILRKGYQYKKHALILPCDIVHDRDVALKMRDGKIIYADVFRPVASHPVPAIVNWAPYGKADTGIQSLDFMPNHFGIKKSSLSGLQSWEGNDPAYWCNHGYAVVQVDARGTFNSEGDIIYFGQLEGKDGHDAIEEIGKLPWCSGRVGMAGNSWLAIAQWVIAAENPNCLKAIAPWEGITDPYRDVFARGGIPDVAFPKLILDGLFGKNLAEDPIAMLDKHPLFDEYWQSKIADISNIKIPAYVVSSYTNLVHSAGTFRGWDKLNSIKWLRIHNTHEWPDFYDAMYLEDLRKFFDFYLLEKQNEWKLTPKVRMSVLDPGNEDTVNRAEQTFPPEYMREHVLYLGSGQTLSVTEQTKNIQVDYIVHSKKPFIDFEYEFKSTTELIGYANLDLWVSLEGDDDGDIYVQIQKINSKGKQVSHQTTTLGMPLGKKWMPLASRLGLKQIKGLFYNGPDGMLRISRRGMLNKIKSGQSDLALTTEYKLKKNQIVNIQIPFIATAMRFNEGEKLRLRISAVPLRPSILPGLPLPPKQKAKRHIIHLGADFPSKLILPLDKIII